MQSSREIHNGNNWWAGAKGFIALGSKGMNFYLIWRHLRRCHNISSPNTHSWKWSNGVEKIEMDLFWCISVTNNLVSCKKINGWAETFIFSVFTSPIRAATLWMQCSVLEIWKSTIWSWISQAEDVTVEIWPTVYSIFWAVASKVPSGSNSIWPPKVRCSLLI